MPDYVGENVNIAITADDRYADMVFVWAYSVAKHSNKNRRYNIYVVTDHFSNDNLNKLRQCIIAFDNCYVYSKNVEPLLNNIPCDQTWSKESVIYYATLFLPIALPELHRCIYMDVDMIALKDLGELYDTDMGSFCLGAVSIYSTSGLQYFAVLNYYRSVIGCDNPEEYFSNGVMLLDFDRIRNEELLDFDRVIDAVAKKNLLYADQDAINILMRGKVFYLDPKWNVGTVRSYDGVDEKYSNASNDPYVIHFNGPQKPTTSQSVKYFEKYWEIAREMDCYEDLLANYQRANHALRSKIGGFKNNWIRKLKNKYLFWKHRNFVDN